MSRVLCFVVLACASLAASLVACVAPAPPVPTATPIPSPTAAPSPTPEPSPTARPRPVIQPRTADGNYYLGRADAPVTLDEYGDFQCPACGEFARTIEPQLRTAYFVTGKVRLVWHDYPWIGNESYVAAQAARCAGEQGGFWAYHDYLYANQRGENLGQFAPDNLKEFALDIGLDGASFDACLDAGRDLASLRDDVIHAIDRGVNVTPYFFVNDRPRVGAPPLARFAALLDAALTGN
jgi:protein-disulfide isomerase